MLELGLLTKPLIRGIFMLNQHRKVLQLKLLEYCNGVIDLFFGYDFLVHVNSFGKAGHTEMRESLVQSHKVPRTSHRRLRLFPYTFFAEKHIRMLSFKYCG